MIHKRRKSVNFENVIDFIGLRRVKKCVGSAFDVTGPLNPFPLQHGYGDIMTAKFPRLNRKLFAQKYFKKHKLLFKWEKYFGVKGTLSKHNVSLDDDVS